MSWWTRVGLLTQNETVNSLVPIPTGGAGCVGEKGGAIGSSYRKAGR